MGMEERKMPVEANVIRIPRKVETCTRKHPIAIPFVLNLVNRERDIPLARGMGRVQEE